MNQPIKYSEGSIHNEYYKEPKYLYVYKREGKLELGYEPHEALNMWQTEIIGKIRLEELNK